MAQEGQPTDTSGLNTPPSTLGFGPRESADETRQAQQSVSNDAPTDVNMNAIVARDQALTTQIAGKNYEASANRISALQERFLAGVPMGKPAT